MEYLSVEPNNNKKKTFADPLEIKIKNKIPN